MRIHRSWLPASLVSFGALACGPHVSVGDLGSAGGAAGEAQARAGATAFSDGGGSATSAAGAGSVITQPGSGGALSVAGAAPLGDAGSGEDDAGGGVGGSPLPAGCPENLQQALPAQAADCPAAPVTGACDWTENAICVWQESPLHAGFTAQGCYAAVSGKVVFESNQGGFEDASVDNDQCPKQAPAPDSSCATHAGQHCYYPFFDCTCAASDAVWQCKNNVKPASPPVEVERLCPPAGIDETKRLKDLSDAELLSWCNWYGDPSGEPRPKVSLQDPPDTAQSYASRYLYVGVETCLLELPAALCVKNIRTQPDCSATVAELDDCVETLRAAGSGWVGHGCAPLTANPTCSRVIAQPIDPDHPSQCPTPLQ